MPTMTCHLVGSYFRPPASKVLLHLPAGAQLQLRPEPDNPYDEGAIAVWVRPSEAIPQDQHELLEQTLEGTGVDLEELLGWPELHLGYVAKSGGKTAGGLPGNQEVAQAGACSAPARLGFTAEGKPLVEVELPQGQG